MCEQGLLPGLRSLAQRTLANLNPHHIEALPKAAKWMEEHDKTRIV